MFNLGITEILLVLALVLIIFGAGKLPEAGSSIGKALRNFKRAAKNEDDNLEDEENDTLDNKKNEQIDAKQGTKHHNTKT